MAIKNFAAALAAAALLVPLFAEEQKNAGTVPPLETEKMPALDYAFVGQSAGRDGLLCFCPRCAR